MENKLKLIREEVTSKRFFETPGWFYKNFSNNGKSDLQVGHGLPGQMPLRTNNGDFIRDPDETLKTEDQYALYKGNVVRAGYLSNYAYGYAAQAAGIPEEGTVALAQLVALKSFNDGDNLEDLQAIREGWHQSQSTH